VSDQFSLQRFAWVLRNDLMRGYRSALVISGTAALVALVVSVAGAYDGDVGPGALFYRGLFIAALFAWGTIATSTAFSDLHGRATNAGFLLLPASALEKTLSRLLLHTVGLIVYLLVFTTALSWVLEGINTVWIGERREFFTPLDALAWSLLPHFIVVQALFFLGAVWFRKVQFVKTVAALIAIVMALSAFAVFVAWMLGPRSWSGGGPSLEDPISWIVEVAPWLYYFALPLLCWFVAWLRVTETQVSHGI
jgi:hypothetical protein